MLGKLQVMAAAGGGQLLLHNGLRNRDHRFEWCGCCIRIERSASNIVYCVQRSSQHVSAPCVCTVGA